MPGRTLAAAPRQRTRRTLERAPARPLNHNPAAVREAREARGLTQAQLAAVIGCTNTYVSEIEGGTRDARVDLLERIAAALDAPVELLERPRAWEHCPQCGHHYEPRADARMPVHLRDDGTFCDEPSRLAKAA
jgi:DNA-binding XRE family transcriptional regulator